MLKVAVTGSYAAGKSHVLSVIKERGYKVFNADDYVRNLYEDKKIQDQVLQGIDGLESFSKVEVAKKFYFDEKFRKDVEGIIHPLVIDGINDFASKYSGKDLVFYEIPVLFEAHLIEHFDISVCVYCDDNVRQRRASGRLNYSPELFAQITSVQATQELKKKLADYVINSDQDEVSLSKNLDQLIQRLKEK